MKDTSTTAAQKEKNMRVNTNHWQAGVRKLTDWAIFQTFEKRPFGISPHGLSRPS
jgi:hypothetical protein